MTTILFVRHGEVDNPEGIFYGRAPGFVMSQTGKNQIKKLAQKLTPQNITKIFTSPQPRTWQTARILKTAIKVPVKEDSRLDELASPLAGKISFDQLHTGEIKLYSHQHTSQGGETEIQIASRMFNFAKDIGQKYQHQTIIAVSHGDPIQFLTAKITGIPLKVRTIRQKAPYPNLASITSITVSPQGVVKLD